MNFYHFFFQPTSGPWYSGGIWGNMVAWVICGFFAIAWARRKLIKWNHRREDRDDERHEDMKAHVTSEHEKSRNHLENYLGKRKRK